MKLEYRSFETKYDSLDEGKILGRASVYEVRDQGGDNVRWGAFANDLAARGNERSILADHDHTRSIGLGHFVEKRDGLHVAIDLVMELQEARDAYVRVKRRIATGLSIGYETVRQKQTAEGRDLLELRLWETSIVVFPMNVHAQITAAKGNTQQLEALLTAVRSTRIALDDRKAVADLSAALFTIHNMKLRTVIAEVRSRLR